MPDTAFHRVLRAWAPVVVASFAVLSNAALEARETSSIAIVTQVTLDELPSQARTTYRLIWKGGPFPYEKDGSVFGNRERLLPHQKRGYYREYTVKTPWSRDRGARRIVCGGEIPKQPDACYYTSDHYNSFRKIAP